MVSIKKIRSEWDTTIYSHYHPKIAESLNGNFVTEKEAEKKCLVVGCGPSLELLKKRKNIKFFTPETGFVICCHSDKYFPRCDVVASCDMRGAPDKEIPSHKHRGTKLVYGDYPFRPWNKHWYLKMVQEDEKELPVEEKTLEIIDQEHQNMLNLNTGIFAIEYAALKGFKEIYTIGIDLTRGTTVGDTPLALEACNKRMNELQEKGIKIYKFHPKSNLDVVAKRFS